MQGFIYPNEFELQWGLLVVLYPYLTGLVAGAFILASLERVFNVKEVEPTYRLSLLTALAFLLVGAGLHTTQTAGLTAILAAAMLGAFLLASRWLGRGADPLLGVPWAVILMAALYVAVRSAATEAGLEQLKQAIPGLQVAL